ncbi:MAG: hypothetical protein J4478_00945 [Candidatus Diapherotrites archaeon]|uniref:Uncharacterized protein n=1 Tax=Candidatus Iainarchaeum sp. TaxID=3101447 RepID=A0A7J4JUI6_9ARCH|nr:hypothetical protein [Candidatus Diapherotrites archaeon]HIH21443.1 hypothetical protein [Candidatus Diapherotrites archaeon]HIH33399.1 hypothetical protein [Candidatus Diapherotrites archaeon]
MGFVSDFIEGTKKAIPGIAAKVGSFLLFIFVLGMLFGYFIVAQKGAIFLLVPIISMAVMYYKLDEGTLVFVLLMAVAIFL